MTDLFGFGEGFFGDESFGGLGTLPPGQREGRTASSWVSVPHIYRANIAAEKIDILDNPPVISGEAEYNNAFATKRKGLLDVRYPDDLRKLRDWLVLELEMTSDLGDRLTIPLMHGVVTGHDISMDNTGRVGSVHVRHWTELLHIQGFPGAVTVFAGADHGAGARDVLGFCGVPPNLINIPDSGTTVAEDIVPLPGETKLAYLTRILRGGGMYQPYVAADYRITSRKSRDIRTSPADGAYHSANGAKIVPPVREPLSDLSGLYNQVTVHKQGFGDIPDITFTATVTDTSSPVHPQKLADQLSEFYGQPVPPVILPRPMMQVHQLPEEPAGTIVAALIAISSLSEGVSQYQPLTIQTYPDHTLDAHQILDLDLTDPTDGTSHYSGKWIQNTWKVRMRGVTSTATRDLGRTEGWQ